MLTDMTRSSVARIIVSIASWSGGMGATPSSASSALISLNTSPSLRKRIPVDN
jgi:hypothetical protein